MKLLTKARYIVSIIISVFIGVVVMVTISDPTKGSVRHEEYERIINNSLSLFDLALEEVTTSAFSTEAFSVFEKLHIRFITTSKRELSFARNIFSYNYVISNSSMRISLTTYGLKNRVCAVKYSVQFAVNSDAGEWLTELEKLTPGVRMVKGKRVRP